MKDYYEYRPGDGERWWYKTPPPPNPAFQRALTDLAGVNTFGNPILRVSWAGTLLSDVAAKPTLKFKLLWEGITGFYYFDDNGNTVSIDRPDEAPKDKIAWPRYEVIELGRPRWIIEKWQSAEHIDRIKRFDMDARDENGDLIFRSIPREGVYNAWFWITTRDGGYRDLDMGILDPISAMWRYQETTSVEKQWADMTEDAKKEEIEAKKAQIEVWETEKRPNLVTI